MVDIDISLLIAYEELHRHKEQERCIQLTLEVPEISDTICDNDNRDRSTMDSQVIVLNESDDDTVNNSSYDIVISLT